MTFKFAYRLTSLVSSNRFKSVRKYLKNTSSTSLFLVHPDICNQPDSFIGDLTIIYFFTEVAWDTSRVPVVITPRKRNMIRDNYKTENFWSTPHKKLLYPEPNCNVVSSKCTFGYDNLYDLFSHQKKSHTNYITIKLILMVCLTCMN